MDPEVVSLLGRIVGMRVVVREEISVGDVELVFLLVWEQIYDNSVGYALLR